MNPRGPHRHRYEPLELRSSDVSPNAVIFFVGAALGFSIAGVGFWLFRALGWF